MSSDFLRAEMKLVVLPWFKSVQVCWIKYILRSYEDVDIPLNYLLGTIMGDQAMSRSTPPQTVDAFYTVLLRKWSGSWTWTVSGALSSPLAWPWTRTGPTTGMCISKTKRQFCITRWLLGQTHKHKCFRFLTFLKLISSESVKSSPWSWCLLMGTSTSHF